MHQFHQNNLDALFIADNAPGQSAFNMLERRVAPLSKMSGFSLCHVQYRSHLNAQGNAINLKFHEKYITYAVVCVWQKYGWLLF